MPDTDLDQALARMLARMLEIEMELAELQGDVLAFQARLGRPVVPTPSFGAPVVLRAAQLG